MHAAAPPRRAVRPGSLLAGCLALLGVLCALLLGGCGGGSGTTDGGGFTSSLRHSAQAALNSLQFSAIPMTLVQIGQTSQTLQTCTVHVMSTKPLVLRLFIDWYPTGSGKHLSVAASVDERLVRFTWLAAEVPANGSSPTLTSGQIPATVPIAQATRELDVHEGPALQPPFEECEVLPNGSVYGYAYGTLTSPISTSTVLTSASQTTPTAP